MVHLSDVYKCGTPGCEKAFSCRQGLKSHTESIHGQNKPKLTCDECSITFTTKAALRKHKRFKHAGIGLPFQCPVDGCRVKSRARGAYQSRSRSELALHIASVHHKVSLVECHLCDARFWKPNGRNKHLKDDHGGAKAMTRCVLCKQLFVDKQALRVHIRGCHSNETLPSCDKCHEKFSTSIDMEIHKFVCGIQSRLQKGE